ncbi:DUF3179 domain-containing (seleno)protein [Ilumatobacter nonamiensis]|uniref:DUF3179 domain-containing (seleno)protein n=1 Tax=Ilumatobacter nonamiensis TaxID=467093 RepID=UPI00034DF7BC|nr:DUF3179 domain-containing (seleno)protein [Ilumatobacter nonamiensis]
MQQRVIALGTVVALALAACDSGGDGSDVSSGDDAGNSRTAEVEEPNPDDAEAVDAGPASASGYVFPPPPESPEESAPNPEAEEAIDRIVTSLAVGAPDASAVDALAESGDPRHAWFVTDLLRFFGSGEDEQLVDTFETLTGESIAADPTLGRSSWLSATNHMIAWDTPAYAEYRTDKGGIFTLLETAWSPFFDDEDATIDWRLVSWGGVLIDDRPLGDPDPCPGGCIPSLDDPATTDADGGDWYADDRIVFGIAMGDEALAIPLNIAEIHEMFNLTLGGERLAIPYCTLCGSAQAFVTDRPAEELVMRTSGLLSRSNKVMYDLVSESVFDTFTREAVTGPLLDEGVVLDEATVVRSTWAEWKREHPDTRIIAQDGGVGRSYDLDPLGGRDDDGPIFPVGDVDPRLEAQEFVVGVIADDGTPIAFPSEEASAAFNAGDTVVLEGVELRESGDGLVAFDSATGDEVPAHEAFWFAWSQFHPDTLLWAR